MESMVNTVVPLCIKLQLLLHLHGSYPIYLFHSKLTWNKHSENSWGIILLMDHSIKKQITLQVITVHLWLKETNLIMASLMLSSEDFFLIHHLTFFATNLWQNKLKIYIYS